jgi:hypothetical protein
VLNAGNFYPIKEGADWLKNIHTFLTANAEG